MKLLKRWWVSMPYFGLLPFLPLKLELTNVRYCVSMPYFGLLPFLHFRDTEDALMDILFQCPTSGFFLFYGNHEYFLRLRRCVSMPYFGLLPFLRTMAKNKPRWKDLFQCPTSGFFLFYLVGSPT